MHSQSKTKLSQLVTYVANPRRLAPVRIQPVGAFFSPQPRQLPLGELARCENTALLGLLQAVLPVQVSPQLPIACRAHRRMSRGQVAALVENAHLIQKSRRHHCAKAIRKPLM